MNYRHIYHAGYFADVFKHVLLIALVESFLAKDSPFFYMDTHAGIGRYDLRDLPAQKTQEYKQGIGKVLEYTGPLSSWIQKYLAIVKDLNPPNSTALDYYPGSPRIARALLRPQDRMLLTELHPEDYLQLKQEFAQDKQVIVHHYDAYQALKAFLPPNQKRGLVLIDPPFEKQNEFEAMLESLLMAKQRWSAGCFGLWYPIKNRSKVMKFYRDLRQSGLRELLCCELAIAPISDTRLTACGLVIANPPWQFQQVVEKILKQLTPLLSYPAKGSFKLNWLVKE